MEPFRPFPPVRRTVRAPPSSDRPDVTDGNLGRIAARAGHDGPFRLATVPSRGNRDAVRSGLEPDVPPDAGLHAIRFANADRTAVHRQFDAPDVRKGHDAEDGVRHRLHPRPDQMQRRLTAPVGPIEVKRILRNFRRQRLQFFRQSRHPQKCSIGIERDNGTSPFGIV